jgi:putative ABC transport system permease protein
MTNHVGKIFYLLSLAFYFIIIIGIVNAMFMGIMERTREIGTMMAVGFKRKQIVMLFIYEGFFLSLIGALVGSIVGALLVYTLNKIGLPITAPGSSYKFMMRPWVSGSWLAASSLTVIVCTSLVSFWPAYRASRLNPVEALQST